MSRVVDIGSGTDPHPAATETVDLYAPADHQFDLSEPWVLDDASVSTLIARHVVEHLDPEHVFREAGRVLEDGGTFVVTVPLGEDARTDPDHTHEWTYGTAGRFARDDSTHWDVETPFAIEDVSVRAWLGGPLRPLSPLFNAAATAWPAWAAERCFAGELTARYRRCPR